MSFTMIGNSYIRMTAMEWLNRESGLLLAAAAGLGVLALYRSRFRHDEERRRTFHPTSARAGGRENYSEKKIEPSARSQKPIIIFLRP